MSPRIRPAGDLGLLTVRQWEVLALVAEGWSNAAIAGTLSITERGVVQHISNIYLALGLFEEDTRHRRVVAARRYLDLVAGSGGPGQVTIPAAA